MSSQYSLTSPALTVLALYCCTCPVRVRPILSQPSEVVLNLACWFCLTRPPLKYPPEVGLAVNAALYVQMTQMYVVHRWSFLHGVSLTKRLPTSNFQLSCKLSCY